MNRNLKYLLVAFIALTGLAGYVLYNDLASYPSAKAAETENVAGFAWSQNIGWISFNSLNCDMNDDELVDAGAPAGCPLPAGSPMKRYGVNLDVANNLSGYAWSQNIGWITFGKGNLGDPDYGDISGCPYGTCQPRISGPDFLGWARACSVFAVGCSGALKPMNQRGGWDGWISLSCNNGGAGVCASSNYQVSKPVNDFFGFAWGDLVTGWISFNSKNCNTNGNNVIDIGEDINGCPAAGTNISAYKVYWLGGNPTLNLYAPLPIDYCNESLPGAVSLEWEFDDVADGYGNQTAYEIELTRSDGLVCSSGKRTTPSKTLLGTEINNFATTPDDLGSTDADCASFISYGGYTYTWKLRVFDSIGNINNGGDAQGYKTGVSFPDDINQPGPLNPTPAHSYPIANFSIDPAANWLEFLPITFDPFHSSLAQPTQSFSAGGVISELQWDFDITDALIDITENPVNLPYSEGTHEVQKSNYGVGVYTIDLGVTDSDGLTCWAHDRGNQKTVTIGSNKPKWNEAVPD